MPETPDTEPEPDAAPRSLPPIDGDRIMLLANARGIRSVGVLRPLLLFLL